MRSEFTQVFRHRVTRGLSRRGATCTAKTALARRGSRALRRGTTHVLTGCVRTARSSSKFGIEPLSISPNVASLLGFWRLNFLVVEVLHHLVSMGLAALHYGIVEHLGEVSEYFTPGRSDSRPRMRATMGAFALPDLSSSWASQIASSPSGLERGSRASSNPSDRLLEVAQLEPRWRSRVRTRAPLASCVTPAHAPLAPPLHRAYAATSATSRQPSKLHSGGALVFDVGTEDEGCVSRVQRRVTNDGKNTAANDSNYGRMAVAA